MLRQLSIRNAKKQFKNYSLYLITLVCTVSFMYAFNTLIFSDNVKALSSLSLLPYMIVATSALIIVVMGWIVSYMTNYMLKKRSKEFSIYMVSGIPNRSINTLIFYENFLIGSLAFLLGIALGILLSQFLENALLHMFGMLYTLHFNLSLPATGLTILYFGVMLLYSLYQNGKWIHKVSLHDLLLLDRQNEKPLLKDNKSIIGIFFLSLFLGCAGIFILYLQPLGNGFDALFSMILLILFLFGFFLSAPTFLVVKLGNQTAWKYHKNRLITFRGFTAKIHSTSIVMGMLSVLFMLSMTFIGIGIIICVIANKNIELSVFDIMILHNGELQEHSVYENLLSSNFSIQASHTYPLYTDTKQDFLVARNRVIAATDYPFSPSHYAEFQYDTYIKQSDYIKLRELLGYESIPYNPSSCYVHCIPALEEDFAALIEQKKELECAGFSFATGGIFTEPFSQMEAYGNGLDYVIVVPDQAVNQMKVLYCLYTAITTSPLNSYDLDHITEICEGLVQLDRSMGKSVPGNNAHTSLIEEVDYLSGKWADKESLNHLYVMSFCLFYLALILVITGAAILATQILSDREQKQKQDSILLQLGMSQQHIDQHNNHQLSLLFLYPILPSILISNCFIYICAEKIQLSAFHLPVFTDTFWYLPSLGISFAFFLFLYSIYYLAVRISYGHIIPSMV